MPSILADYKNLSHPGSKEEVKTNGEASLAAQLPNRVSSVTNKPYSASMTTRLHCLGANDEKGHSCRENLQEREKFSSQ